MTTQGVVGSIVSLWRYPVKSMKGEELNATEVAQIGLLGDRAYALVDSSDAKAASAKNPRKWPQLFDFRAALADAPRTDVKVPSVRNHLAGWHFCQMGDTWRRKMWKQFVLLTKAGTV